MPYTQVEREAIQSKMFGCTSAEIDGILDSAIESGRDALEVALSLLSDSQEQMRNGATERARQTINVAKYIIDKQVSITRWMRKLTGSSMLARIESRITDVISEDFRAVSYERWGIRLVLTGTEARAICQKLRAEIDNEI